MTNKSRSGRPIGYAAAVALLITMTVTAIAAPLASAQDPLPEVEVVKFEDTDGSDGFTYNVDEGLAGFEGPPVDRSPRLGGNHVSDGGEADPNAA